MTARKLSARTPRWWFLVLAATPLTWGAGCSALNLGHAEKHIPHPGIIDCNQPRELQMVSLPPYVVEPPDEIEVSVKPVDPDFSVSTMTVQADGTIDTGFLGDVYVAGLTLEQVEQKFAQILNAHAGHSALQRDPYQVSVRLVNGSASKSYYVLGTVTTQGKFPVTGSETVLDAIVTAGLRTNSIPEKAYLVRPHPHGGPNLILKIDWIGIKERGDTLTNYQVFPGDRIIVPGGKPPGLLSVMFGGG